MVASNVTTDELIDRYQHGFRQTQILTTAVRLGIFDVLRTAPLSARRLAKALDADVRGVRILCNALVGMQLLERRDDGYANAAAAREHLLPDSPRPKQHMILHAARLYETWGQLYDVVRTGRPADKGRIDARLARDPIRFARAMADIGRRSAAETAALLDLGAARRVLDAGGGPGVYALEFACREPRLCVTVFDTPETLVETRRNIAAAAAADRVSTRAGDLLEDDLGGPYDLILASNLIHCLAPEQNRCLMQRFADALEPGGCVCIKDFILAEDGSGPEWSVLFAVNMLVNTPAGEAYTAAEIGGWFGAAGLVLASCRPMATHSTLLVARKPAAS